MRKTNDNEVLDREKTKKKTSTPKKNSTTKSSTTSKTAKSEKTVVAKSSTTRKKKISSKPSNVKSEETKKAEQTGKNSAYINPEILKFEERLKKRNKTSISTDASEINEIVDLQETLANLENSNISTIIEEPQHSVKKNTNKKSYTEPAKTKISKKNKKEKSNKKFNVNYIYHSIIAICIILIIYSVINIVLWQKNNIDNSNLIKQVSEITPVTETNNVFINENLQIEKKSYDFTELLNQNSDTVGWIHINNTDIDYPVVKSADNDFYLTHAFDKSYNATGWIYADYRNRCDDTDTNLIIYGHNRLNDNMFGTLENVLSNPWLENENNHYIHYSSTNKSHIYSIFSAFICTSDESINYLRTSFSSNADFSQYKNSLKKLSSYDFKENITENDKIITLYTCHGLNNERLIVFGKLIN